MISQHDKDLFRLSVENNTPLDKDDTTAPNSASKHAIFKTKRTVAQANLSSNEVITYAKNGTSSKLIKKMKQGKIQNAPLLDLHQQTTIEACQSMAEFIHYHQNATFLHLIHGKGYHSENGMSILKTQVAAYLKAHPSVLAFHSCPAKDGGTGAVFVLIKQ